MEGDILLEVDILFTEVVLVIKNPHANEGT